MFESWVVSPVSSYIRLGMLWRVEPAASVGERLDVNGGRGSGEGAGAPTGLLNKQGQLLPRALGSYSELFDFPIHYFLRTHVGLAASSRTPTALDLSGPVCRRKSSGVQEPRRTEL